MGFKDSRTKANFIVVTANSKKAEDIVVMDMSGFTTITDFFVILTARNQRAARAIADEILVQLKEAKAEVWHIEGYEEGLWVLIDCGDIIIHIFMQRMREFYDLERLWADAPREMI